MTVFYQINDNAKATLSMEPGATSWQVPLGSLAEGDVVEYYIAVTDNSGRRERSEVVQFTVQAADLEPPEWRNRTQSAEQLAPGAGILLQAEGFDAQGLREARLETNETGTWEHRPEYGSPLALGDIAQAWQSTLFTWNNPALAEDTSVSWRIRYVDAAGNETVTEEGTFLITTAGLDLQRPTYADPNVELQRFGEPGTFSLRWNDNEELSGYRFSFDDGSGTFVDDPLVPFVERAHSPWWNEDWQYRREITVDHSGSVETLTNQPLLITLDTQTLIADGKLDPRAGDLRFVWDGDELDYWIESGLDTPETRIWVRLPELSGESAEPVALYYGNPNRTVPQSDGASTFPLFDDFGGRGWEEFKYENNPIKGPDHPAGAGTFSSVLLDDDGVWKMYSSFDEDRRDIALSTSNDGLNWERYGVVLRKGERGEWDSLNTWAPVVWKEEGIYYMLHPASGPTGIRMGLATSEDGINWTKYDDPLTTEQPFAQSDPVFNDPVWATDDTESPCFSMVKEGDTYYVMYDTLRARRRASFASSTDLINWTPVYEEPRFPGGESPTDWNYNTFCGHTFAYEDEYYLIMPGQDNLRNYAKFGLYVSSSPVFPEDDTEFKGIVMVGDQTGWESEDMDTPWVVQFDNKMHMYYAACGECHSETGVAIFDDISLALTQAYAPGNYVGLEREITASQRVMPPAGWEKSIRGYREVNGLNYEISLDTSISGRAAVISDLNTERQLELFRNVESMEQGVCQRVDEFQ